MDILIYKMFGTGLNANGLSTLNGLEGSFTGKIWISTEAFPVSPSSLDYYSALPQVDFTIILTGARIIFLIATSITKKKQCCVCYYLNSHHRS